MNWFKRFKMNKFHKELYDESYSQDEFELLKEIQDRYGQNITDRIDRLAEGCKEDFYVSYISQLLDLKHCGETSAKYNTLGCLMIRETLFVLEKQHNKSVLDNLIAFASGHEVYLDDVLYTVAAYPDTLDYFEREMSLEDLNNVFSIVHAQLTKDVIADLKNSFIWSKISV